MHPRPDGEPTGRAVISQASGPRRWPSTTSTSWNCGSSTSLYAILASNSAASLSWWNATTCQWWWISTRWAGCGADPCAFRWSVSCFGAAVMGSPFKQPTCQEQTTPWRTACQWEGQPSGTQQRPTVHQWIDTWTDGVSHPVQQSGTAPDRSPQGQQEQSTANLLQLGEGPKGLQDAMSISWNMALRFAFPPIACIPRVLEKLSKSKNWCLILIAPRWPHQTWFSRLPTMVAGESIALPLRKDLIQTPGGKFSTASDSQDSDPDSIAAFVRS